MWRVSDVQSIVEFGNTSFHNITPSAGTLLEKKNRACVLL